MDKRESPSSHISKSLSLIKKHEEKYQSIMDDSASLKDHILSLKLGLPFLKELLDVSTNEDLKKRIKRVVVRVGNELHSLSSGATDGNLILELDVAYANLREKIKNVIMKPEATECDVLFPKFFSWDGFLKKTNDFLLKIFKDLSSCKADLFSHLLKEIEGIQETLSLLQPLLNYVARTTDETKEVLTPLLAWLGKVACLLYSCLVEKMDEAMTLAMKQKLSDLLQNINVKEIYMMVLRASKLFHSTEDPLESGFYLLDNLIKLLDSNENSFNFLNGQSEKLHGELKFLRSFLTDLPHEQRVEKFNYLVSAIEAITSKSIPILRSCYDEDIKEDMAKEVDGALSEVLAQIKDIRAEVKKIKLYHYPTTDELGVLDLFLGHLKELLKFRAEMIEILKGQIETLHGEFGFLRSFLRKIKGGHNENEELKELCTNIIRLAYQAELAIDFFLVKYAPESRILSLLSEILEETKLITSKVTTINVKENPHTQVHGDPNSSSPVSSQARGSCPEVAVGFEDEAETIMEYLLGDHKKRDVVSIVGMPGLGKTTLAKKIYEAPSIVQHFHVRAWCTVSQKHQRRDLLLTILGDIVGNTNEINRLNDEELAAQLHQKLKGRRYLIVIDDLWDTMAWDDLRRSVPDDRNRSRILITSRIQQVASQLEANSKVHNLRRFSDDESWELFQKKQFQEENYSDDFLQVGKRIAEGCKGLPLAVIVIAGLLAKVPREINKWKEIEDSLGSLILSDSESPCMAILELSYNHLPDYLKSCFLYFGAFQEDKQIPVCKLKWLWIAEGFVRNNREKSLEITAEEYFMELINRSLVSATKERSQGGVKTCRMHDILRDFCLEKAKEESFLQVIDVHNWSTFSRVYDQHRLCIDYKAYNLMKVKPSSCSVRSLLHSTDKEPAYSDVSFIFQNFKLLRVLDLASTSISSLNGLELLIHLTYLAIQTERNSIPFPIANLWKLQFFQQRSHWYSYNDDKVDVPDSLWDMVNLRHVHINKPSSFSVHPKRLEKASLLDNLETLATPCLSYGDQDTENLLRRLPGLRKLRCIFLEYWDDSKKCVQFPVLDFLSELMSLKGFAKGSLHWGNKCEFSFPSNLQKLTLIQCHLSWDDISRIGRMLPNLKVLKLIDSCWSGKWIVNDEDFPSLKYLKLSEMIYRIEWIASEDSFPVLEQLVVENCCELKEIPPRFGEIPTLRMILVKDCHPSLDNSAKGIQKNQHEELQNEEFKVHIYPMNQYQK